MKIKVVGGKACQRNYAKVLRSASPATRGCCRRLFAFCHDSLACAVLIRVPDRWRHMSRNLPIKRTRSMLQVILLR